MQARSDRLHVTIRPIKVKGKGLNDEWTSRCEVCVLFYYCTISLVKLNEKNLWLVGSFRTGDVQGRSKYKKFILLTLYLPRFCTEHVKTASRPAGNVTFWMVPSNSGGSASNPWRFISEERAKKTTKVNFKRLCRPALICFHVDWHRARWLSRRRNRRKVESAV